jgi:hypothetical protein
MIKFDHQGHKWIVVTDEMDEEVPLYYIMTAVAKFGKRTFNKFVGRTHTYHIPHEDLKDIGVETVIFRREDLL